MRMIQSVVKDLLKDLAYGAPQSVYKANLEGTVGLGGGGGRGRGKFK